MPRAARREQIDSERADVSPPRQGDVFAPSRLSWHAAKQSFEDRRSQAELGNEIHNGKRQKIVETENPPAAAAQPKVRKPKQKTEKQLFPT